jgi:RNA polymerase sigma-70 factor (ECF subfamily)
VTRTPSALAEAQEQFAALVDSGLRALLGDDCRLDLVSKAQRRGKQVGEYFSRYEKENVALRLVRLDGGLAFAAYVAGAAVPAYFILLELEHGRVQRIATSATCRTSRQRRMKSWTTNAQSTPEL